MVETKRLVSFRSLLWCLTLLDHGVSGVDPESVSVMEEDSVTLNTGVQTNQQNKIRWYYDDTRIAQINGDLSKICTDVQCNEDTERFRDRLKLDHQTGSLTIMNITNTDSGEYKLKIFSGSTDSEQIFSVSVHGVSAAERDEMKRKSVMEGESVTLDPGEARKPKDLMTCYFNYILIAEISGDQSKICTDVQCKKRFTDRLKLNQAGCLTITNSRNTDSGEYKLLINSSRFSISKSFSVSVTDVPDSGSSPADAAAITVVVVPVVVVLLFVAVGVIYCLCRRDRKQGKWTPGDVQDTGVSEVVAL